MSHLLAKVLHSPEKLCIECITRNNMRLNKHLISVFLGNHAILLEANAKVYWESTNVL